ncbi:MAG: hypothetical protein ACLTKQ_08505 [Acutalibacteraceae bacterium]
MQKEVKAAEKALSENEENTEQRGQTDESEEPSTLFSKELENMKLKLKAANKELDSDKLKKYDDKMKASANSYTAVMKQADAQMRQLQQGTPGCPKS